jgi:hypothetical protein
LTWMVIITPHFALSSYETGKPVVNRTCPGLAVCHPLPAQ